MAAALTKALLTEQMRSAEVRGLEEAKAKLADELRSRLGADLDVDEIPDLAKFGHVDDEYVSFEWSSGGMVHVHMAFRVVGAPRIDKKEVPQEKEDEHEGKAWVQIDVVPEGATVVPQSEAANRLATFLDRAFTEFNVAKATVEIRAEKQKAKAPGSASAAPKGMAQQQSSS